MLVHTGLAFGFAAAYALTLRALPVLRRQRPVLLGAAYGASVWIVMDRLVLPLTGVPQSNEGTGYFLAFLVDHIVFVGLPIALLHRPACNSARMQSLEDAALARLISARSVDAEAESEFYRRFARRVRLYGLRHLRDEAAADDLVQDVLTLALESLRAGRVQEPDKLASFVPGSCRNVVMNQRRTEGRRRARLLQLANEQPDAGMHATPTSAAQLADCLAHLHEATRR